MKGQIPIFGMVPIEVSSRPDITLSEIRVFNAIASFQGNDNSSFPSLVKISERAGINEVNCSKAIGKLKKKGLVDSQRRYGTSNIYRIIYDFKPLEEIREERKNLLKEARIAKLKNLNSTVLSNLDNIETRQDDLIEIGQDSLIETRQDDLIETRYTKRTDKITNEKKRGKEEAEPQNSLSLTSIYKDFYTWLREEHFIIESIHLNDSRELNKFMFESTFPPEINEAEILFNTLKVLVDKNKRIQKYKRYSDTEKYFGKEMAGKAITIPNSFTIQVLLRFSRLIESCEEALPKEKPIQKKNPNELSTLEKQKRQAEYSKQPKEPDMFWETALNNAKKEIL